MTRSPAFSAVVLTIALGVGATTVIFSVADHVVLRPLAYAESGRLVVLREVIEELRDMFPSAAANASHYLEWRRSGSVCEDVGALRETQLTITGRGDPVRMTVVRSLAEWRASSAVSSGSRMERQNTSAREYLDGRP